jgi:hypothetical protein
MDCGALITVTGSLLNCVDVKKHITIIETAKEPEGESIVNTHMCSKTYFVKNWVVEMVSNTASAIHSPRLYSWKITQSGEDLNNPG